MQGGGRTGHADAFHALRGRAKRQHRGGQPVPRHDCDLLGQLQDWRRAL